MTESSPFQQLRFGSRRTQDVLLIELKEFKEEMDIDVDTCRCTICYEMYEDGHRTMMLPCGHQYLEGLSEGVAEAKTQLSYV